MPKKPTKLRAPEWQQKSAEPRKCESDWSDWEYVNNGFGHLFYTTIETGNIALYGLYVDKTLRRRGHARNLIRAAVSRIRASGYRLPILIEAIPQEPGIDREDLVRFYRSEGLHVLPPRAEERADDAEKAD